MWSKVNGFRLRFRYRLRLGLMTFSLRFTFRLCGNRGFDRRLILFDLWCVLLRVGVRSCLMRRLGLGSI
jgi:hypothetical protein